MRDERARIETLLTIAVVEGLVVAGDLAGGPRAAHVQGVIGAECGELVGAVAERVIEVEPVGHIQDAVDRHGADVVGVNVEPPPLGRLAADRRGRVVSRLRP